MQTHSVSVTEVLMHMHMNRLIEQSHLVLATVGGARSKYCCDLFH